MKTYSQTAFLFLLICTSPLVALETEVTITNTSSTGDHVTENLMVMMGQNWDLLIDFAVSLAKGVAAWVGIMLLIGIASGILCWMIVRKCGLLKWEAKAYRYVSWLWVFVFIVPITAGAVSSAPGIAFERSFRHLIVEEQFCRKLVANLYCAAALNTVDYNLNGTETVSDMTEILSDSESLQEVVNTDIGSMVKDLAHNLAEQGGVGEVSGKLLSVVSDSWLGSKASEIISKEDPAVLIITMYAAMAGGEEFEHYQEQHPQANIIISGMGVYMERLENQTLLFIGSGTKSATLFNLIVGFSIPLILVALFQILRNSSKVKDKGAEA